MRNLCTICKNNKRTHCSIHPFAIFYRKQCEDFLLNDTETFERKVISKKNRIKVPQSTINQFMGYN